MSYVRQYDQAIQSYSLSRIALPSVYSCLSFVLLLKRQSFFTQSCWDSNIFLNDFRTSFSQSTNESFGRLVKISQIFKRRRSQKSFLWKTVGGLCSLYFFFLLGKVMIYCQQPKHSLAIDVNSLIILVKNDLKKTIVVLTLLIYRMISTMTSLFCERR